MSKRDTTAAGTAREFIEDLIARGKAGQPWPQWDHRAEEFCLDVLAAFEESAALDQEAANAAAAERATKEAAEELVSLATQIGDDMKPLADLAERLRLAARDMKP